MKRNPFTLTLWTGATLLILATSCREQDRGGSANDGNDIAKWFPLRLGEANLRVQLAVTPEEKAKGLMFRERLAEGYGMLFVFREPGKQRFWMRNTRIPLDLGYFSSEGILREVHAAQPFDESGYPSRNDRIKYVLELNQGAYRNAGLAPGAKLNLREMAAALRARGVSPTEFGVDKTQADSTSPQ